MCQKYHCEWAASLPLDNEMWSMRLRTFRQFLHWMLRQARQIDDGARELRAASGGQLVDGQGYVMTSVVDNDLLVSPTGT